MRTIVILAALSVLLLGALRGEESSGELTVREKLHARLLEALPPLRVAKPPEESVKVAAPAIFVQPRLAPLARTRSELEAKAGDGTPVVVMAPFIVSDEARNRNLAEAIERQKVEPFSIVRGGTAYRKDFGKVRMELGGWWTGNGVAFLRFSW